MLETILIFVAGSIVIYVFAIVQQKIDKATLRDPPPPPYTP